MAAPAKRKRTRKARKLLRIFEGSWSFSWSSSWFRLGFLSGCVLVFFVVAFSMRHRIQDDVDADRIPLARELVEVLPHVAFPLERVAEIGVVRHEHEHVAVGVERASRMRDGAVASALRSPVAKRPEADRRNLRQLADVVEHVEDRMF